MNKDAPSVLLAHHLKALKLPTILRGYESTAQLCAKERSGYAEFLLRLTERELIEREQRASERRIRQAMFPVPKTLDSFDFTMQPSVNEASVRELMRGEFVQRKENVLLLGNPGTGKSHLATVPGHAVCVQGLKVSFFQCYRTGDHSSGTSKGTYFAAIQKAVGAPPPDHLGFFDTFSGLSVLEYVVFQQQSTAW